MNGPQDQDWKEALRRDREAPAYRDAEARIAARLGFAPLAPGAAPSGLRKAAAPAGGIGLGRALAILTATFVAGGVTGAGLYASLVPHPIPPVVYVPAPAATPSEGPVPVSSASEPTVTSIPSLGPASPVPPSGGAEKQGAAPQRNQLDVERDLLDRARTALLNDETDGCLRVLDRYAKAYRHPILAEEHDALLVQALVRGGRADEARARAEDYRRKFPNGLLRPAVDSAIAQIR